MFALISLLSIVLYQCRGRYHVGRSTAYTHTHIQARLDEHVLVWLYSFKLSQVERNEQVDIWHGVDTAADQDTHDSAI